MILYEVNPHSVQLEACDWTTDAPPTWHPTPDAAIKAWEQKELARIARTVTFLQHAWTQPEPRAVDVAGSA
jgi:hypothetical protein